ncbi:MAG: SAM-dependent methyltransferase [Clostridia bacterium]|nr:SAM-dependent methyltransferase [Clostridia bacterium]
MNKLGKRLSVIAGQVSGKRVADVGCDHGKLAKYLFDNKKVESMILSDISEPSLRKAIDLISPKGYNCEYICCDGLKGYADKKIDECVISGMGGEEIIKIISTSPINIDSFILSPQRDIITTKKFMLEKGFSIIFDIVIKEKEKFYNVFKCVKKECVEEISEFDLYFGKTNFESNQSDLEEFVDFEIKKVQNILDRQSEKSNKHLNYLAILNQYKKRK